MIKLYGKVVGSESKTGTLISMNDCIQTCYNDSSCILAQLDPEGYCSFYYHNTNKIINVEESTEAKDQVVGFKCTLPDNSCPSAVPRLEFPLLNITWEKISSGWSLTKCRDDWKMFKRSNDVLVCMKFFELPLGASLLEARNFCQSKNAYVTGVQSREETNWMQQFIAPFRTGNWDGAWIDGHRNCNNNVDVNCQNYTWSDGYTVGSGAFEQANYYSPPDTAVMQQCLIAFISNHAMLNAVSCTNYEFAVGTVCGYQLK